MYYINKIVGFLVSPIGGAIAGGIVAVVCARLGRKRMAQWIGGLTVAWLWLWMTPIMTWVVGVPLEREFLVDGRVPAVETFPDADAIILLGGGMGADTNHNSYAEMSAGADRVWQAARLYKVGKASKIIATEGYDAAAAEGVWCGRGGGVVSRCKDYGRRGEGVARRLSTQRRRDAESAEWG